MGWLDDLDLSVALGRDEESERLEAAQERLLQLRLALAGVGGGASPGPPVCVLFEGWDASGKGGAIRRLVARLDPRHVHVAQFGPPTEDEKRHHFLRRFAPALPGWGELSILDRSWYGRVLVERVEKLTPPADWKRAYGEIVAFERALAAQGVILSKFWLHISSGEQLRRFKRRAADPLKAWKLTDDDWRNRERRRAYLKALDDMLARTDHDLAPWHVVEAESKRYARVKVAETVVADIEAGMRARGLASPPPIR